MNKPFPEDRRRLRDGARATTLADNYDDMPIEELQRVMTELFDGALALQSMDDLGSPDANDQAWNAMKALDEKLDRAKATFLRRTGKTWRP